MQIAVNINTVTRGLMAMGMSGSGRPGVPTPAFDSDFLSGETLDPRITFSRTTNATRINSAGVLEYAPHNLLTFSEQFDNAAWSKTNISVSANTSVSPNNTTTADKIVESTANALHYVQLITSCPSGVPLILSVYAKAAERTKIELLEPYVLSARVFNLSNGTVENNQTGVSNSSVFGIENVGNGWYRCYIGVTSTGTSTALRVTVSNGSATAYTGDGASGALIWGAQLNVGALQPYYPTTVKNLLGFSEAFENAAWTKSNSFIQTNLLTWSEDITNAAWTVANVTRTADTTTAPNETNTADTWAVTSNGASTVVSSSGTITAGSTVCASVYIKKSVGTDWIYLAVRAPNFSHEAGVFININTGAIGGSSTLAGTQATYVASSAVATPVGNGWYRISAVFNTTVTTSAAISLRAARSNGSINDPVAGDSYFIWGAQLVQGSTPGDYQQTFSAALPVMYKAPNGLMTADKLVEDTVNNVHQLRTASVTPTANAPYTFSVYAKKNERRYLHVGFPAAWGGSSGYVVFDLETGTQTYSSNAGLGYSITLIGDGWYRCSVLNTVTISTASTAYAGININSTTGTAYTGDGTSGIYIWGAQLSDSASLDTYVNNPVAAPTAAAYYGPRFNYDPVTLAPQGLLVEEQRTNLCTYSDDFSNAAWSKGANTTVTSNYAVAPDGTMTADRVQMAAGAGTFLTQAPTLTAGTTYTISVYVRATSGTSTFAFSVGSGGTVGTTIVTTTWERKSITFVYASGTIGFDNVDVATDFLLWGAQLEAGAFATSYIPTTTAQVTRAADVATIQGSNFSGFYNQNEGTLFTEAAGVGGTYIALDNGTSNERNVLYFASATQPRYFVSSGGSTSCDIIAGSITASSNNKITGAYKINDFATSLNGAAAVTDTLGNVAIVDRLRFGVNVAGASFLNGTIRKIAYFPRRLSNDQLRSLTS